MTAEAAWAERARSDKWAAFIGRMRRNWGFATSVVAATVAIATILAFALPSYWRVEIVVVPVPKNSTGNMSFSALAGGLGGLASLSGLGALLGRQDSTETEALAVLSSRELFDTYAKQQNLLPVLFASKWDAENKRWDVSPSRVPTLRTGYKLFKNEIRDIDVDRRSGIVTLAITWKDRQQAVKWAHDLVDLTNQQLRQRAVAQALQNMKYLSEQMRTSRASAESNALNAALANAFERQLQDYMFAKGQKEYVFRIIDPATIPDDRERVWPQRPLFVALGLIFGCIFAVGAVHLREFWWQRKQIRDLPAVPHALPNET